MDADCLMKAGMRVDHFWLAHIPAEQFCRCDLIGCFLQGSLLPLKHRTYSRAYHRRMQQCVHALQLWCTTYCSQMTEKEGTNGWWHWRTYWNRGWPPCIHRRWRLFQCLIHWYSHVLQWLGATEWHRNSAEMGSCEQVAEGRSASYCNCSSWIWDAILLWMNERLSNNKGQINIMADMLNAYVGLELAISIHSLSNIEDYWSTKELLGGQVFQVNNHEYRTQFQLI